MTEQEAEKELSLLLKEKNCNICPMCRKIIDRGDIAWNNPSTEAGTDYTIVEIICSCCDTEIARISSWYPGADSFAELVEEVLSEEDWILRLGT